MVPIQEWLELHSVSMRLIAPQSGQRWHGIRHYRPYRRVRQCGSALTGNENLSYRILVVVRRTH
jgi:hypothetical protein